MSAPSAGPAARILVIDDDAWILRMVTAVLEKRGYVVQTASDGEDGLAKAMANPPDLVICDVMMPRKDGWTVVKALRAQPEFAFVPVIFLSALGSDEDRIRGFKLGADDYLPKPFRFEELDLRVTNAIRRRQRMEADTRGPLRAPAAPADKPAESGVRGSLDQIGLASLLTVLEMERKSGTLALSQEGEGGGEARSGCAAGASCARSWRGRTTSTRWRCTRCSAGAPASSCSPRPRWRWRTRCRAPPRTS